MRVCARARLARAPSPHSMSPTHFHGASAPPRHPRLAQPRAGPAPPPSGPPSLSRAPINQPRRCQSSGGSPRPPAAATAIAAPGPGAGAGLAALRLGNSAISFRRPGLGESAPAPGRDGRGAATGLGLCAPPPASGCAGVARRFPAPPPKRGILIASGPRASDAALSRELFPVGDPLHQWCCMQFQKLVSLSFPNTLVPI